MEFYGYVSNEHLGFVIIIIDDNDDDNENDGDHWSYIINFLHVKGLAKEHLRHKPVFVGLKPQARAVSIFIGWIQRLLMKSIVLPSGYVNSLLLKMAIYSGFSH